MRSIRLYHLLLLGFMMGWLSCANIVSPTGGPKDTVAPTIKKRSLVDSAINFKGGKIEFDFDEFVQIKDLQNQLIITPLLKANPKITAHKRHVVIQMEDSLLEPNTTYTIQLGNAIQDIREGNSFDNLRFTFSTGAYFDSLTLRGAIYDASTGKPDTSSIIVLYPANLPDSAFFKQKPMYVQKAQLGSFVFNNLPDKSFHIYALTDANKNLRYDLVNERIAFYNNEVQCKDSVPIILYSFIQKEQQDSSSKRRSLNKPAPIEKRTKINFSSNIDTINKSKRTFDLNDSIKLRFELALKSFDQTKIRLFQDSVLDASAIVQLDSTNKVISISTQWTEDATYKLMLMKGYAQDSSGLQGLATQFIYKTKRASDYGFLTLLCNKDEHGVYELIRNDKVIARKRATDTLLKFSLLNPDNYQLRLLHDENMNGSWDTGSLFDVKKQPEITEFFNSPITIKANWENKINITTGFNKKSGQRK